MQCNLPPSLDRLSGLLERFRIRAQLYYTGQLCGEQHFSADAGRGYLHVLRRGSLQVVHPPTKGVPERLLLNEPTVLFYPLALTHHFHNPPVEGSDFTCAALDFEGGDGNPIARALPRFMALPLAGIQGLDAALDLLFAETDRVRCGQRLLADRLFEVVLIQLLRWLLDNPEKAHIRPGLITGLSEPRLARTLVCMHEAPEQAWSLDRMAACAGMSRTGFANTFRDVVGQTPAEYLADWRIALAKEGLLQGRPIKLLAGELGYANPSALSRMFVQRTGYSPRKWFEMQR